MRKAKYKCSIKSSRKHCSPYGVRILRIAFQSFLIDIAKIQHYFELTTQKCNFFFVFFGRALKALKDFKDSAKKTLTGFKNLLGFL